MLFAEVVVETRGERAAEQRVHDLGRRVAGNAPGRADGADADRRLRGARLVDQPHGPGLESDGRGHARRRRGGGRGAPRSERLLDERQDVAGHVAGDDEGRRRRDVARGVERPQIGDGERGDRGRVAPLGPAVAVGSPEHRLRQGARGDPAGHVAGLEEVGERLLAQAPKLALREVRPQRDVGHHRQGFGEARHGHAEAHDRRVPRGLRAELSAEEVDRVREGQRVSPVRPLVEHVRGRPGEALAAEGVGGRPGAHDEEHLDHGHLVHGHEQDADSVREREPLDGGQLQRLDGPRLRRGAAVGLGEEGGGREHRDENGESQASAVHRVTSATARSFFPSGTTETSTRPDPSQRDAAACTSLGESAR